MRGLAALTALTMLYGITGAAALPEDYLDDQLVYPEEDSLREAGVSSEEGTALPEILVFPWIRLIDFDRDRHAEIMVIGSDRLIVLGRSIATSSTLPCGEVAPGGELRDCGEGKGVMLPGSRLRSNSIIHYAAAECAARVDNDV